LSNSREHCRDRAADFRMELRAVEFTCSSTDEPAALRASINGLNAGSHSLMRCDRKLYIHIGNRPRSGQRSFPRATFGPNMPDIPDALEIAATGLNNG